MFKSVSSVEVHTSHVASAGLDEGDYQSFKPARCDPVQIQTISGRTISRGLGCRKSETQTRRMAIGLTWRRTLAESSV
jgi:hypothetical protein